MNIKIQKLIERLIYFGNVRLCFNLNLTRQKPKPQRIPPPPCIYIETRTRNIKNTIKIDRLFDKFKQFNQKLKYNNHSQHISHTICGNFLTLVKPNKIIV
jgi:hypothetical protein